MATPRDVPYPQNALFRGIPQDALQPERFIRDEIEVPAGTIVFREGDPPDFCYLISRGALRITKSLPTGEEELLATLSAGDFVGELGLYDFSPRSATVTAALDANLARIDRERFDQLRDSFPLQITSILAERTIERVRDINTRFVAGLAAAGRLRTVGAELGTLSHNLRGPLATIRNAADLLHDWVGDPAHSTHEILRFVQIIRATADTGLTQIDELMARLRGGQAAERQRIPVAEIVADVRTLVSGFLKSPSIRYRDDHSTHGGEILVERLEFVAALSNLVKNGIEALPPEGGEVVLAATADGNALVFSVSDTGSGISPDLLPLLFERSFTHGKAGGTGLGLAHVLTVAERHGGKVDVQSAVGRGTTVSIRIPVPGDVHLSSPRSSPA
jgi:signal transduction histidine kinase